MLESGQPRYDYCYWDAALRLFPYNSGKVGKLGYPNQILEGSEYFGTSIFRFSILELVEIDPHIAYIEEKHFGRFCTDFLSLFGG